MRVGGLRVEEPCQTRTWGVGWRVGDSVVTGDKVGVNNAAEH